MGLSRPRGPGFHLPWSGCWGLLPTLADRGARGIVTCGGGVAGLALAVAWAKVEKGEVTEGTAELMVELGVRDGTMGDDAVPLLSASGDETLLRSVSLSERNRSLSSLKTWTPVDAMSRIVDTPSRTVMRFLVVSSLRISSRKGA